MIAHTCHHAATFGSGVHGDVLANEIIGSYFERTWFAFVFQILRRMPDRGKRINLCPRADAGSALDNDMGVENNRFIERDMRADNAISANCNVRRQMCLWVHDGGRMDVGHFFA